MHEIGHSCVNILLVYKLLYRQGIFMLGNMAMPTFLLKYLCFTLLFLSSFFTQAAELVSDVFYVPVNASLRSLPVLDNDTLDKCTDCSTAVTAFNPNPANITIKGGTGIKPAVQFQAPTDFIGTATFTYSYDVNGQSIGTAQVTVFVGIDNDLLNEEEEAAYDAWLNACDGSNGQLQETCKLIEGLDDEDAHSAINQMMPRDVASQAESSTEAQRLQLGNLNSRLMEIRNNGQQSSSNNLNAQINGDSLPLGYLLSALLSGGAAGDEDESWMQDYGFFMNGNIRIGDKNNTAQSLGYELDSTGITFGVDKRINSDMVLGLAMGYGQSAVDYSFDRGGQNIDSLSLLFYGNYYFSDAWYMDGMLSYALNDYDLERFLQVNGAGTTAFGDTSGSQYSLALSSGYGWSQQAIQYAAYGRLEYINTAIDAYSETGGDGLALEMGEQKTDSIEAFIGGSMAYVMSFDFGVLIPSFDLEYATQLSGDARAIEADFVDSSSPDSAFTMQTDSLADDYFNVAANLSATFSAGRSAFIRYEQTLALDNYSSYQVSLGGRISF